MQAHIREGWVPGIIGFTASTHARYYAREWGFGPVFEAQVASGMAAFVERYDRRRDLLLCAEIEGEIAGTITIDGSDPALPMGQAHMRWFIVSDVVRGQGVGRQLFGAALNHLTDTGFTSCYLTTFAGLDPLAACMKALALLYTKSSKAKVGARRCLNSFLYSSLATGNFRIRPFRERTA